MNIDPKIKLDIGGKHYTVSQHKLVSCSGFFRSLFLGGFDTLPNGDDGCSYRVDFESVFFDLFVVFFDTRNIKLPSDESELQLLLEEAEFFQIDGITQYMICKKMCKQMFDFDQYDEVAEAIVQKKIWPWYKKFCATNRFSVSVTQQIVALLRSKGLPEEWASDRDISFAGGAIVRLVLQVMEKDTSAWQNSDLDIYCRRAMGKFVSKSMQLFFDRHPHTKRLDETQSLSTYGATVFSLTNVDGVDFVDKSAMHIGRFDLSICQCALRATELVFTGAFVYSLLNNVTFSHSKTNEQGSIVPDAKEFRIKKYKDRGFELQSTFLSDTWFFDMAHEEEVLLLNFDGEIGEWA